MLVISHLFFAQMGKTNIVVYTRVDNYSTEKVDRSDNYFQWDKDKSLFWGKYINQYTEYVPTNTQKTDFSTISENADFLIFQKLNDEKSYETKYDYLSNKFYIIYENQMPNWKVFSKDKKQILGYDCIKAEANIRGEKWIVWFSNKIPTFFNVLNLTGLPGLVLSATIENKSITYTASGVLLNTDFTFNKKSVDFFENNLIKAKPYEFFQKIEEDNKKKILEQVKATQSTNNSIMNIPPSK